jgi:hypothetical protein
MLISTTLGEIEDYMLTKTEMFDSNVSPTSLITEYKLNGIVVRRDVSIVLQPNKTTTAIGKL